MSSSNFNVETKLLSNEDINHFQSVVNALLNESANISVVSNDKNTITYIYNLIKHELTQKNFKNLSLYHHEKLESFLADSLLGPFENAFSKITEISNSDKNPDKKILFITDISKLDEREVNLLVSLNSKKLENSNSIVVFFHDTTKTSYDKNKLLKLFDKSIKWEPDVIGSSHNTDNKETKEDHSKTNKKSYSLSKKIFLTTTLFGILFSVSLFITTNISSFREYSNQVLNYFKTLQISYFNISANSFFENNSNKNIKNNPAENDIKLNIEILDLSGLSQFHISTGYVIQYSAHFEKVSALKWIAKQHNIVDPKLIKLEKNSDNSKFYAVVSKPFENYKQAVDFASNEKFTGKAWVRSLKSIKKSQAKKNYVENYF